jgi:hypothetical protein
MEGKLGFTITPCWQLEMHLDSKLIIPVLQAQNKHLALRTKLQPIKLQIPKLLQSVILILKMLVCKHNMDITLNMKKQNFVYNDQVKPS